MSTLRPEFLGIVYRTLLGIRHGASGKTVHVNRFWRIAAVGAVATLLVTSDSEQTYCIYVAS